MSTIHVAGGVGVAPTAMSAYDAALADANLHNYNLITVSSVIPADATLELVDAAPDLGPAGNKLTVVQGKTVAGPESDGEPIATGIGWATGPGPGLFYEASGTDPEAVEAEIRRGLDAGPKSAAGWMLAVKSATGRSPTATFICRPPTPLREATRPPWCWRPTVGASRSCRAAVVAQTAL